MVLVVVLANLKNKGALEQAMAEVGETWLSTALGPRLRRGMGVFEYGFSC